MLKIYDNGGKSFDRYTLILGDGEALFMSINPLSHNGVCMHGEVEEGQHLGKQVNFENLPEAVQKAIELEKMG